MRPRLRQASKVSGPHALNDIGKEVVRHIAKELVCWRLLGREDFEGKDWERTFASAIGAEWKPSSIGLDDVQLGYSCWGAKTVKNNNPFDCKSVRLISGRNSLAYSFKVDNPHSLLPEEVGNMVISIWNERLAEVSARFKVIRTVVLIKGPRLESGAIFEVNTRRYDAKDYAWHWNERENLIGTDPNDGQMKFTWQPHGSQFTIREDVPTKRHCFQIHLPESPKSLDRDQLLALADFDESWIKLL